MRSRWGVVLLAAGALVVGLIVGVRIGQSSDSGPPGSAYAEQSLNPAPPVAPTEAPTPQHTAEPPPARTPEPTTSPGPTRTALPGPLRDLYVVDGDTVAAGSVRVRLLGIDTPEAGECGFDASTAFAERFVRRGGRISNRSGHDHYGRLLAYVSNARGRDLGAALIRAGLANARYDSTDGYDWHPNQDWYRRIDARTPHACVPAADTLGGP